MSDPLQSPSWYRVAALRPRLRGHARFHRHRYRGQRWYVLEDRASGRVHRLRPAAWYLIGLMDGRRSTQDLWQAACAELGDDAPSQDETIRLLGMLHGADLLHCDVGPDTAELLRRTQRRERAEGWRRFSQPLSVRLPLCDPDAFLERWLPVVRPLLSRPALLAGALGVALAALLAASQRAELAAGAAEELLAPRSLLIFWLVYPLLKGLHELGHAFATKHWGGEVHELGVLFLVFVPVPYVDASAASAFADKWKRIGVGAAGIAVELVVAAVALGVWLAVEPGLVRSVAYSVLWISGASTLLFNGNPLLRFDGYYVLCDWIEIPNLRARSTRYFASLIERHAFGLEQVRDPVSAPGEPAWFVGWGLASAVYRVGIALSIALFVAERFFFVGVLLALAALASQIGAPLWRQARFLLRDPRLGEQRPRALLTSAAALCALLAALLLVPLPLATRADGVVWPPDEAVVRSGAGGFVEELLVTPPAQVEAGQPLLRVRDASLETELAVREARLQELRARHRAARRVDLVLAQNLRDELAAAEAAWRRTREQVGEVVIRSPARGRFVASNPDDLVGRYLRQGELVGYVVGSSISTARVVIPQESAAWVQDHTRRVELRLSRRPSEVVQARILARVPAASDRLPSAALGVAGGGSLPVDPADPLRTTEPVFELELALLSSAAVPEIGGRVHVRFDHGVEPIAWRGYRAARRLLLGRLGV